MTGEVLYRMFQKFGLDRGVSVADWNELPVAVMDTWRDTAEWIMETGG